MIDPENLRTLIDYLYMVKYSPYNVEVAQHYDFTRFLTHKNIYFLFT